MRKWIAAITIMLAILCWHAEAQARCSTHTIWGPDGKVLLCSTCCSSNGSNCTTTCF